VGSNKAEKLGGARFAFFFGETIATGQDGHLNRRLKAVGKNCRWNGASWLAFDLNTEGASENPNKPCLDCSNSTDCWKGN